MIRAGTVAVTDWLCAALQGAHIQPQVVRHARIADMTAGERELMTFAEVAERLGVDVNTIRRNVKADQIPVVRRGRKVRIPAAWVDDPHGWPTRNR